MTEKQPQKTLTVVIYEQAVLKEVEKAVKKVIKDCHKLKVPIAKKIILEQKIAPVSVDWYARTGMAVDGKTYVVTFSARLFLDYHDRVDQAMKNIAAHELCHTCKGAMNHREGWKKWVRRMNEKGGYSINEKPYSKKETEGLY